MGVWRAAAGCRAKVVSFARCSVKKRRTEKGQEAPADQDANPETQGCAGDDFGAWRRFQSRPQRLEFAECRGAVEGEDVEAGERHEEHFEAESVIVEILI